MKDKKLLILLIIIALCMCMAGCITFIFFLFATFKTSVINNFDDCVSFGNPIIQTYPEQCSANGKTFTQTINPLPPVQTQDYYGSSTNSLCNTNSDCIVNGCNGEICGGKSDPGSASVCVFPDKPLPKDLGYSCQCQQSKCQWVGHFTI